MKTTALPRALAYASIMILLTACASAKPIGEWRDEGFKGNLGKILVIGVTARSTRRRVWEDQFVNALFVEGARAVPSYTLLESSLQLTRDIVERAIEGQNFDGVMVTRLVGIEQEQTFKLPANYDDDRGYLGYYDHAWRETSSGYYAQYNVFTLETTLYDVASGKLVWSMQSQSMDASQPRDLIKDQIQLKAKAIKRQGLI